MLYSKYDISLTQKCFQKLAYKPGANPEFSKLGAELRCLVWFGIFLAKTERELVES